MKRYGWWAALAVVLLANTVALVGAALNRALEIQKIVVPPSPLQGRGKIASGSRQGYPGSLYRENSGLVALVFGAPMEGLPDLEETGLDLPMADIVPQRIKERGKERDPESLFFPARRVKNREELPRHLR